MRPNQFQSILRYLLLLSALFGFTKIGVAQSGDLAITHVTVINPGVATPQLDMTILIRGRDIALVGRTKVLKVPALAKVIDGTGKFIIPGLWDMHSHFRDAARDLKMDVANGVVGIRDMGGVAKEVFPLRDEIAAGQRLGPKIVASGPIVDGPDSWSNPKFTVSMTTADEARSMVRSLKDQGADFIKVSMGCRGMRTTPLLTKQRRWAFHSWDIFPVRSA